MRAPLTNTLVRDHYAHLDDPRSQTSAGVVRRRLRSWLEATASEHPGLVLDLGAGVGDNLSTMAAMGPAVGLELSASAARRASRAGVVAVGDGARLPFREGAFDRVVCTEVLEHVEDPDAVLKEAARVLGPGGLAFVTSPNYANLCGLHKWLADRRSPVPDWNPWGAHRGGYEAMMTGRRLARAARPHLEVAAAAGLDHGQAITGRFARLDRMAQARLAHAVLRRLVPALEGAGHGLAVWHGMQIELVLRRRDQR